MYFSSQPRHVSTFQASISLQKEVAFSVIRKRKSQLCNGTASPVNRLQECHLKPGITGRLEGLFQLTSKVLKLNISGVKSAPYRLDASPENCARCHRSVLYETVISDYIRISHREIYSETKDCLSCHHFQMEKGSSWNWKRWEDAGIATTVKKRKTNVPSVM